MFCPKCGVQNADGVTNCSSCGNELPQQAQVAQPTYTPMLTTPRTSPMAIWSLVLSILGFCTCITAIPGLILGILGVKQCSDKPEEFTGKGLAIAGIVLSLLAILVSIILSAILLPVFVRAKNQAQGTICQSNVMQLGSSMMMYSNDYDGKYPTAAKWCDTMKPYVKNAGLYICPALLGKNCGYGFNSALGCVSSGEITNRAGCVLLFESDGGWNGSGGPESMIVKPRHQDDFVIGYADGHAKGVTNKSDLQWDLSN